MGLLDNDQRGLLKQAEMRPTPRNALLGLLADVLESGKGFANKAQIPASVPLLGGQGLGDLVLGQAPQELSEWSYGNAPMRINPLAGRTAGYMPEMKHGRGQGVADALMLAQVPGGKNALLAGMGMMDNGVAKSMIPVRFEKTTDWAAQGGRRIENGEVVVKKASGAFNQQEEKLNALYFAQDELSPQYSHFWRFTNNKDEAKLASTGALRASRNHLDGTTERGLSVASGPHYGIHGYKHVYPVQGRVVGYGSDGEPLLDPKTVRALSGMQDPKTVMKADRDRAAQILRERGLPDDFMRDGVVFRNTPNDLFP